MIVLWVFKEEEKKNAHSCSPLCQCPREFVAVNEERGKNPLPAAFSSAGPLPRNPTKEMNPFLQLCSYFLLELGTLPRRWLCKSHSVPSAPGYPCLEGSQHTGKARIRGWDPHRHLVPRPLPALDSPSLLSEV